MPSDIQIRPLAADESNMVRDIIRTVMAEFGLDGPGTGYNDPALDLLFDTYDQDEALFLVVAQDGRPLGGGGILPLNGAPGWCELGRMYLLPEARGHGFAARVLAQLIDHARQVGYRGIYLETSEVSQKAQALYRGFGFRKTCSSRGATGHGACGTYYELELTSA